MAVTGTIETIAEEMNQRVSLCKLLALSSDRWYTVTTYWVIHDYPGHALGNITMWAIACPFIEARLGTRWFATICISVTIGMGIIIVVAKSETLTGENTAKGLSIIGWMTIVLAARPWIAGIASNFQKTPLSNGALLNLGILATCILLAGYAIDMAEKPKEIPASMIGHLGGTATGLFVAVIAVRKGKFNVNRRITPIWQRAIWPAVIILTSFAFVRLSVA